MSGSFSCLMCFGNFETQTGFLLHKCTMESVFKRMEVLLKPEKLTRSQRFRMWLLSIDISYLLATLGVVTINTVFLYHFKFSFWEALIEGFSVGLVIPRLLK